MASPLPNSTPALGSLTAAKLEDLLRTHVHMPERFLDSHAVDALKYSFQRMDPKALNMSPQMPTNAARFTPANMKNAINSRMGWNVSAPSCPHREVVAHKLNDEQAVVFVITGGNQALLIHDDVNLFPSDALVTQLRLLEQ